ncbi:MAG: carbonic anhydrase [Chloroflexi bacterium]|nr:carbonic anhydrase [Chloroflexota bacterium]
MDYFGCQFSRRTLFRGAAATALTLAGAASLPGEYAFAQEVPSPDEALARLQAGNARFVAFQRQYPNQTPERRAEVVREQRPYAAILSCADSRVPPEIAFDSGIGDLFVLRLAGNVWNEVAVGSLEFAVANFGTPLIVVLGHQRCGAVAAAIGAVRANTPAPGSIDTIVQALRPPVEQTLAGVALAQRVPGAPSPSESELVELAAKQNVRYVVNRIAQADVYIRDAVTAGRVKIVGMYYSLDTGEATLVA